MKIGHRGVSYRGQCNCFRSRYKRGLLGTMVRSTMSITGTWRGRSVKRNLPNSLHIKFSCSRKTYT